MSLINEMLHNLEKRRNQEARQVPVTETVMNGQAGVTGGKLVFAVAAVVVLAGLVWAGISLLPTMSAEKAPASKPGAEQAASPAPAKEQRSIIISPMIVKERNDSAPVHPVLPEMKIETPMAVEERQPYPLAFEEISDAAREPQIATDERITDERIKQDVAISPANQEIVLTKKERPPSRDKQSYQTGLDQLHRGELEAAAQSLSSALAINPAHTGARLQLIATLQQLKQPEQAARQMRQGLELLPENRALRKEYARYLLNNRQIGKAIELLRQPPVPAVADDMEYHALLAALLQESGQYNDAAKVYARLLQIRPENGIWWLGLAVSMDQTGNFEHAREAYQRAFNLPGLDRGTREYIKNRLEVL